MLVVTGGYYLAWIGSFRLSFFPLSPSSHLHKHIAHAHLTSEIQFPKTPTAHTNLALYTEGNKRSSAREAKRRAALVEKGIRPPPSDSNGDTESEGSATHDGVGAGTSTTAASGGMFEEKDSGSGSGKVGEERIEVV